MKQWLPFGLKLTGASIVPARVRHPRDKSHVEAAVGLVERQAMAALRNVNFFSLGELNAALLTQVEQINSRSFARRPGSRNSVFENQEKQALSPLPVAPYPVCTWTRATVRSDHHVAVGKSFYSVPYEYTGRTVDIRTTLDAVEIFYDGVRIASHIKSHQDFSYITDDSHRPQPHKLYLEWNIESVLVKAKAIGDATEKAANLIMGTKENEKESLRQGKALLDLAKKYGNVILEEACKKALSVCKEEGVTLKAISYLAEAAFKTKGDIEDKGAHALLRGVDYYKDLRKE